MDTLLRETVNAVVNSRFPEMSIEGRRQIENILIREEYPKGAIALNEGEVAHEIVFVGKGMLRQYYYKNGKDVTEHFSYEGCIVMCIESFLKQVPTKLIVETLEPVVLYMFPRDMLFKLAKENWEINMFYQKILLQGNHYHLCNKSNLPEPKYLAVFFHVKLNRNASGNHQTSSIGTYRLLPADDAGNTKPGTFRRLIVKNNAQ